MAHPPRSANAGTFFITAITCNRRRLLQTDANAHLFLETLRHYRAEGFCKLFALVVMPDHVHLPGAPFVRSPLAHEWAPRCRGPE